MDDFLQNAEPRVVAMLLIACVLLISTIQVMYLLWPQIKQYRDSNQSYNMVQRASSSSLGLKQQLKTTTEEVDKLSYKLHGDMAGLPENQMESYIIGRLQEISWASDVELASVVPGRGERVQMFQETLFNVTINATYFKFFNWLQQINSELGYIVIKKFDINPKDSKNRDDPKLAISITLVSYRMVSDA